MINDMGFFGQIFSCHGQCSMLQQSLHSTARPGPLTPVFVVSCSNCSTVQQGLNL